MNLREIPNQILLLSTFLREAKDNVDRVNCKKSNFNAHEIDEPLRHAILNIVDESGEFIKIVKDKMYYNRPIDALNLIEETGDLFWGYILILERLSELLDIPFTELFVLIFLINKAKLSARYSEGKYTSNQANNRDLEAEQDAMLKALGKYRKHVEGRTL